jgi:hypothetical protein
MANDFTRDPKGFSFVFQGMKVNSRPDSLPPGKYPLAVNVRGYSDGTIQTRPGLPGLFSAGNANITDLHSYAALFTDNLPRILARDSSDGIWLDNGVLKGTLAGAGASPGVSMIPFRPGASPVPWMYIANGSDYRKFSAPDGSNVVTQQKVGIKEPQTEPDAAVMANVNALLASLGDPNTLGGTASGGSTNTRVADTVVAALPVDAVGVGSNFTSLQVHSGIPYQKFQLINNTTLSIGMRVYDVFQPMTSALAVAGLFYYSGTTGKCVVVPAALAGGIGNGEQSLYGQNLLSSLRRGALVSLDGEVCLVQSVSVGPNGSISFITSTVNAHSLPCNMQAVPAIMVNTPAFAGNVLSSKSREYQVTVGIGTAQVAVSSFNPALQSFQPDDYIHVSLWVDNLQNLNEVKIMLDVGDGSFTENFYYYTVRPSDITQAQAATNPLTQLGAAQQVSQRALIDEEVSASAKNQGVTFSSAQTSPGNSQWSEIMFPISALTRVGDDQTLSLQNIVAFQLLWNASGTINAQHGETDNWVLGGGQVDVGDVGAPYQYRVRPRSSLTGVVGNPSPATRYGVNPRRQTVNVILPSAAYDPQIDTWDVFRYGGTVTEWRFIGSTPSSNTVFTDNYDDAAAGAGEALDFDNFEPWPTVDVPNVGTAGLEGALQSGICGTIGILSSPDQDLTRYLPGTLIQIAGGNVYTLQTRPVQVAGQEFLVQFVENAGVWPVFTPYIIQEPLLANQPLPYMWGPDADGTVFACGDSFRPGTLSFAKNYAPDSVPDTFNQEISPPSEPLLGGETIDGLSFVASSERWWALYPQPQDVRQRYSVVQQPFPRGLAAPWGHCTDGRSLFWYAKDGIWSSTEGSLTDADFNTFFPHEGVVGTAITYGGVTILPPDYSKAGGFRLAHANGYLYATYLDKNGSYHTLVCDLKRKAWSVDAQSPAVTVFYHPEQQAGTVISGTTLYPELLAGTVNITPAQVLQQQDLANDQQGRIACTLAVGEYDGGDARAPKQWGDLFVDSLPVANFSGQTGIKVTPFSLGVAVASPTVIPQSTTRSRVPISVGGVVVSDFLGMLATWLDDFSAQGVATKLYQWQPSFVIQPARTISWATFGTSYGIDGYFHIRQLSIAYVSTSPITIVCETHDGQDPLPVVLPSTGGNYVKTVFPLSANKGLLYTFQATSAQPFQIFSADSDVYVGAWGRTGPYATPQNFGGEIVQPSPI